MSDLRTAAQQALRALLARAERGDGAPETVAALRAALEQPEQEPVAWRAVGGSIWGRKGSEDDTPLYTHPPRREWQGLTEDETMQLMNETYGNHWADDAHLQRFRKAIEAALKEKNHE